MMNNSSKQDSINMDLNKEKANTVMDTGVIVNIEEEKVDTEVFVDKGSESVEIVSQSQQSNKLHSIDSIERSKEPSNEQKSSCEQDDEQSKQPASTKKSSGTTDELRVKKIRNQRKK